MALPSIQPRQSYADWRMKILGLFSQHEQAREFYWILDACSHPDLPGMLWKLEAEPRACPLYMNTYREEVSSSGPYMLPVRGNHRITQWIFEHSGEHPLGCLAEIAPGTYPEVFEHLQGQTECRPGGGPAALFRWYDPRMLYGLTTWPGLQGILATFMGPTFFLHAWEPGRCADIVCGPGCDLGYRSAEPEAYPESLFDHIWDEAMLHSIIGTLGHAPGRLLRAMPLPRAYAIGERAALALSAAGYDDRLSLAYAVSLSARLGPFIWDEPRVIEALAERPAQASIMEVLDEIGL